MSPNTSPSSGPCFAFSDLAPPSTYRALRAIHPSFLVDVHRGELAELTRQHLGSVSTHISGGLYGVMRQAVENPLAYNDWKGVWHDILSAGRARRRVERGEEATWLFDVYITGVGRRMEHCLSITLDDDGITLRLAEDC